MVSLLLENMFSVTVVLNELEEGRFRVDIQFEDNEDADSKSDNSQE